MGCDDNCTPYGVAPEPWVELNFHLPKYVEYMKP